MENINAKDFWNSLTKEQQLYLEDIMLSTMDMCNFIMKDDPNPPMIEFSDTKSYEIFRDQMLEHLLNKEYFDIREKQWKILKTKDNVNNKCTEGENS